jgi:HlyD family secretion protein
MIQEGQRTLLAARLTSRNIHKAQLAEQIKQYEEQIAGLSVQRDAKAEEIRLVKQGVRDIASLFDRGLIEKTRLTALEREKAKLDGERGRIVSEIAQASQAILERKVQILQIDEDMHTEVVEHLQAVRAEIAELEEQRVAAKERLSRAEIRAPGAGVVHQLAIHTIGGVVAPGEDLMAIVPQDDMLIIEAQISPTDIDQVFTSQEAVIRLPGLHRQSTPELKAKVINISADLLQDPSTGLSYYQARLALPEGEIGRLAGNPLVPGMPAEAFVQSEARSILSYLVEPLLDHIAHMFRESY